jgi:hypothetical protein
MPGGARALWQRVCGFRMAAHRPLGPPLETADGEVLSDWMLTRYSPKVSIPAQKRGPLDNVSNVCVCMFVYVCVFVCVDILLCRAGGVPGDTG